MSVEEFGEDDEVVLTPDQEAILEKLRSAKSSSERVDVVATALDTFGLDPLISLFLELVMQLPQLFGLYLLAEAKNADLEGADYLKYCTSSCRLRNRAVPVAGDVADYLFKQIK